MSATLPSAFELFNKSKDAVLKNQKAFGVVVLLPVLLTLIGDMIDAGSTTANLWAPATHTTSDGNVFSLLGFILTVLFIPAAVMLALRASKGESSIEPRPLIEDSFKYFWRLIGVGLLVGLMVAVGLILLIVPGIIIITRYFLTPYVLVAENKSITEAMKRSAELSKGHAGAIWGVIGVTILLSLISIVPLIGSILSALLVIAYACAPAMRYLELSKK